MQSNTLQVGSLYALFSGEGAGEDMPVCLKNACVENISFYKKARRVEIKASCEGVVPALFLEALEKRFCSMLGVESACLRMRFHTEMSLDEALRSYWEDLLFIINRQVAVSRGIMADAAWELSDRKLLIRLKTKGAMILKAQNCDALLEQLLEDYFGPKLKVEFYDGEMKEEVIHQYLAQKESNEAAIISKTVTAPKPQKQEEGQKAKPKTENGNVVIGKGFQEPLVPMASVTQESGRVAICGDIFRVEFREIRGERFIYIFDMTDLTSSVTVKFFVKKDDIDVVKELLKEGVRVKVRGEAQYDKFSKELGIFASDILLTEKEEKQDTAEEKRVELHLHTQMSSMDGVSAATDLVKRAAKWGHKAIAITDHGVVQAYPDAFAAGKKNKIKIIYGVECYLLNDSIPVVYGAQGQSIEGDFVVFDIETTGLNAETDRITEIGAVKVHSNKIVDTFSSFVNPGIPIPEFITKLTGISDETVQDAPDIAAVLPRFLEFCEGAVLVAHNANFDTGFIRVNARRLGVELKHAVLDTLQLCRNLFPQLGRYKLNIVAKHLGVKLENHHRAVDDSTATAHIFIKCVEMMKEKGVATVDDIQGVFSGKEDYTKASTHHAIILVKNEVGLKNLYKIISQSHLKYFHKKPRVPKKLLLEHREGLILGSACEAGELFAAILDNKSDEEINKIAQFYDYLEIQPLGNNQFLLDNGRLGSREELMNINRRILQLGEKYNKLVVATCDVHFLDPQDEVYRRILMAGQGFTDADKQAPLYLRTTEEMLAEFTYLGSDKAYEVVVTNTNKIADMVNEIAPVPEGTFPPQIEGAEEEIKTLAETRAKELYGDPLPELVVQRLEKELNSIIKNGFAVMYLIAQKLVSKSLSDGYLVGSRGSVGSSFVANMAGITEVNSLPAHYRCDACKYSEFITDGSYDCGFDMPEKDCPQCGKPLIKDGYDIPFETFLGFDGDKEPDIDLNFSGEYQPVIHKYTEELFGKGHVFRAGTIGTVAEKTAYGFVKNYLDERGIVVSNAEINRLVKGCTGIKRTTGQHPGGIMIVPHYKEIYDFSPIQHPADDTQSDTITTHFDYNFLHGSILKLDILGHTVPTIIRMLEDLTKVDATTIPIGEKKTMSLFNCTEALGIKPEDIDSEVGTYAIPEFGTKFVKPMLLETMPKNFSELIRISGLSHGTDVWTNNAQDLIRDQVITLSEAICCRDDIMLYLMHKGLPPKTAFKIMEDVRKGKGVKEEYEQVMKENKVPAWYIQSCKTIKYMFPKAHAAAYVMMAFRIAWYKVYYPVEFYTTYFTVAGGDFDAEIMIHGQEKVRSKIREYEQKGNNATQKEKDVLTILQVVNEAYARNVQFLPIDLYQSAASKFTIEDGCIRPPFSALQGLGTAAAQSIVEARKDGEFISIDDLRTRAKISKSVIEILQQQGCLKGMPESNQLTLFGF